MNKKKKLFISLLSGTAIIAGSLSASSTIKITTNGYTSALYDIRSDSLKNNFSFSDEENKFNEKNYNLYEKYPSFYGNLLDDSISTPLFDDMVPQGLTIAGDKLLVTAYDYNKNNSSVVYVINNNGKIENECTLDMTSHVGGIGYDEKNNLIWIPSNLGKINAYELDRILFESNAKAIYSNLDIGKGLLNYTNPLYNSIAYLTIKDNHLFVGSFSLTGPGLMKEYDISVDEEGKHVTLHFIKSFNVPTKVQGVSFYHKDDKEYILFSRSFGRNKLSLLQIYYYNSEIKSYDNNLPYVSFEAPPMMEQIITDKDKLYTLFESGAKAYSGGIDQLDEICIMDANRLVNSLK